VHHVLVVVHGGEVDQLAGVEEPDGGEGLDSLCSRAMRTSSGQQNARPSPSSPSSPWSGSSSEDDVLAGDRDRLAVGGGQDVVRGQHEDARLDLGFRGERHVDRHLVAVEVRVERGAHEGWILIALLRRASARRPGCPGMQRGSAVEEHRVLADDLLEEIHTSGRCCSTISLAALMVVTRPSFSSLL